MMDGSVMRKVFKVTEGQKKHNDMARLAKKGKGVAKEEAVVAHTKRDQEKRRKCKKVEGTARETLEEGRLQTPGAA